MRIELISIGDELLKGQTLNTNVTFLSRQLFELGYTVAQHTTLPDDSLILKRGLERALAHSNLVIATGGLGPTLDDKTREVAAELFESDFYFDETIAVDLKSRFGEKMASLKDQATVPSKASYWINTVGTAPALVFSKKEKTLILLPGVPIEMQVFVEHQLLPYLKTHFPIQRQHKTVFLYFSLLTESKIDPFLRKLKEKYPVVEVGIYPTWGLVSVVLNSDNQKALDGFERSLKQQFALYLFPAQSGKIEEAIQSWFLENQKTLALAESCTGGAIASQLISLPGASQYFLGSFVTYSNAMKEEFLNVSEKTLKHYGAVSQETVEEMLQGVFNCSKADFAIAVSGIAGPSGGSKEKPVGTIWAAIGKRGEAPEVGTFLAKGNRQTVIVSTVNILLGLLYRKVAKAIPCFPLFTQEV